MIALSLHELVCDFVMIVGAIIAWVLWANGRGQ